MLFAWPVAKPNIKCFTHIKIDNVSIQRGLFIRCNHVDSDLEICVFTNALDYCLQHMAHFSQISIQFSNSVVGHCYPLIP